MSRRTLTIIDTTSEMREIDLDRIGKRELLLGRNAEQCEVGKIQLRPLFHPLSEHPNTLRAPSNSSPYPCSFPFASFKSL